MNNYFKSLYFKYLPIQKNHRLTKLKQKITSELISQAEKLGNENPSTRKQEILFFNLKKLADKKSKTGVES